METSASSPPRLPGTRLACPALLLAVALLGQSSPVLAQTVQLAGLASYRSGGSFSLPTTGLVVRPDSGLAVGGSLDWLLSPTWRIELAYSQQPTKVNGPFGERLGLTVENFFVGLQEERGGEQLAKTRPFGTLLVGATRLVPDFDAEAKVYPAAGLAFGLKYFPAKNLGFRFEGRGIMTFTTTTGSALCNAEFCYLNNSDSSFWQWDFGGGLILAF